MKFQYLCISKLTNYNLGMTGFNLNIPMFWDHSTYPKFSSSVSSYLPWLSEASIMDVNLEFSSASNAEGLSNSKI